MIAAVLEGSGAPVEVSTLAALIVAGSHREGARPVCERGAGIGLAASAPAMVASADGVTAALDGRLDNRGELARDLGLGRGAPVEDGRLLLAAFARWGEGCLSRMIGDFAFVLWDGRRRRLLCGRDALGVRPLHYARVGDTLVAASEVGQLLGFPGIARRPDQTMLVDHLLGLEGEPGRSWYEAVHSLPAGCLLSVQGSGSEVRRYWQPAEISVARRRDTAEIVERFWQAFRQAVGDRLAPQAGVSGVLLGGGLDSSAVAATAADLLGEDRRRLLALYNISFEEVVRECDEGHYVDALSRSLGLPVRRIPAPAPALAEEWRKHPPPVESPIAGWQEPIHEILRWLDRDGGRVLLTGHGGDAVVAGSAEVYADRLARGEFGVLREMTEHSRSSGTALAGLFRYWVLRPLLPEVLRRALAARDVPDWIEPAVARRLDLRGRLRRASRKPVAGSRAGSVIRRQIEGLGGEMRAVHWLGRVAARYGLEIRHPFLDRRLVELVLSTPPEMLFRAGRYKELLRRALGERLPPPIRDRVGKTSFAPFLDHRWRRSGAAALRALLSSPVLAEQGLVRGDRLQGEVEAYLQGRSTRLRPYLWAIITAERWLRHHHAGVSEASTSVPSARGGSAAVVGCRP